MLSGTHIALWRTIIVPFYDPLAYSSSLCLATYRIKLFVNLRIMYLLHARTFIASITNISFEPVV